MIVLAQQNGAGPIVSLSMGPGSAPASIADAPVVNTPDPGDLVLISRGGTLNVIAYQELIGAANTPYAASPGGAQQYSSAIRAGWRLNMRDVMPVGGNAGTLDCTANFQAALTALSSAGGGTLYGNPTDYYLISSTLTIPPNCAIDLGVTSAGMSANGVWGINAANVSGLGPGPGGCILLAPGATIQLSQNSGIRNGYLVSSILPSPPTSGSQAQAAINAFAGTAITGGGTHNTVRNMCIIGFNQAFSYSTTGKTSGRMRLEDITIDCTNGFALANSKDGDVLMNCQHNAFYTLNLSVPGGSEAQVIRQGTFISGSNLGDGLVIINCGTFGHTCCYNFTGNNYLIQIIGGGGECPYKGWGPNGLNIGTQNPSTSPVVGFKSSGSMSIRMVSVGLDGREYELVPGHVGMMKVFGGTYGADGGVQAFVYTNVASNAAWTSVPADTNTGNGTFSAGPIAGSALENGNYVITFTDNNGDFQVSDPLNNVIGTGTAGTAFTSNDNEISFTLAQGSVAWATGDSLQTRYATGLDVSLIGCEFGGGPPTSIYANGNLSGFEVIGCLSTSATHFLAVVDSVLPVLTCHSNTYPSTAATINKYEGMIANIPWQYVQDASGDFTMQPVLNAEGAPIYGQTNLGAAAAPLNSVRTQQLLSSGATYSAAGTNAATATPITTVNALISYTPPGTGVTAYQANPLPAGFGYTECSIINNGNNPLLVYPGGTSAFVGDAAGAPIQVPAGYSLRYWQVSAAAFQAVSLTPSQSSTIQSWGNTFSQATGFTLEDFHVGALVQMTNTGNVNINLNSVAALFALPGNVIGLQLLGGGTVTINPGSGVLLSGSNNSITLEPGANGLVAAYALTANADGITWTLSN